MKMKLKNVKLEWYVLRYNMNKKIIESYNVFHDDFIPELHKQIVKKKKITNYNELRGYVHSYFTYYYWCKAEHEVLIGGLCGLFGDKNNFQKIDIYTQLMLNFDRIMEYIIKELNIKFKNK